MRIKFVTIISLMVTIFYMVFFFLTRSYKRCFRKIITSVDEIAAQIDGISYDAANAGHVLSAGVAQQSSAIDQTISAHADIVRQIQQHLDNADKINALIVENAQQMDSADASMQRLESSMDEIRQAGEDIQKVVGAIDSFSFQTNLLSINAGVESARAGAMGAAFSVISDEIRHLAINSTASAHETASLIEKTILRVQNGTGAVNHISGVFKSLAEHQDHLKKHMKQISVTAMAQSEKIRELDSAIHKLEALTRSNAEHARETDFMSKTLKENAGNLRVFLSDVIARILLNGQLRQDISDTIVRDLQYISGELTPLSAVAAEHGAVLRQMCRNHPKIVEAVYSCDKSGAFIFSEPPAALDNASIRPWWQEAISGRHYVSPLYISAINNQPCCTVSVSFHDQDGQVAGVVGVDLKVS